MTDVGAVMASPALRLGAAWMTSSVVFSTYGNTAFLKAGGSGLELTMIRFLGSVLLGYGYELLRLGRGDGGALVMDSATLLAPSQLVKRHAKTYALPALALLTANYCNSVALKRTGITITYVTKCIIPLFTGLLCFLGLGQAPPRSIESFSSMALLCFGIALASAGNGDFEVAGFSAAVVSALAQSFLTVFSKKAHGTAGLSGPQAQFVMASLGIVGLQVLSLLANALRSARGDDALAKEKSSRAAKRWRKTTKEQEPRRLLKIAPLAVLAGSAGYVEYSLNFAFIALVNPTLASVMDGVRRAAIVHMGKVFFPGDPLTTLNKGGVLLAVLGGLGYSIQAQRGSGPA